MGSDVRTRPPAAQALACRPIKYLIGSQSEGQPGGLLASIRSSCVRHQAGDCLLWRCTSAQLYHQGLAALEVEHIGSMILLHKIITICLCPITLMQLTYSQLCEAIECDTSLGGCLDCSQELTVRCICFTHACPVTTSHDTLLPCMICLYNL